MSTPERVGGLHRLLTIILTIVLITQGIPCSAVAEELSVVGTEQEQVEQPAQDLPSVQDDIAAAPTDGPTGGEDPAKQIPSKDEEQKTTEEVVVNDGAASAPRTMLVQMSPSPCLAKIPQRQTIRQITRLTTRR